MLRPEDTTNYGLAQELRRVKSYVPEVMMEVIKRLEAAPYATALATQQAVQGEARLQQECDTITELNHAQWLALSKASLLVAAANRLSAEAEEFDFDDGLGRGAQQAYWDELESALEQAADAIDELNKTTQHIYTAPLAPQQPEALAQQERGTQAARDVLAERQRQISAEGWTPAHDDEHHKGDLSAAAACYATTFDAAHPMPADWPWEREWWKPKGWRSNLVRAGALILAEIERLDRAARSSEGGTPSPSMVGREDTTNE